MRSNLLEGIRVVEFGQAWAGPFAARLLGDLGAEVIKVEAPRYPDLVRFSVYADNEPGDDPWERGGHYQKFGRNKKSCIIDLASQRGRELFYGLLEKSDVFLDNFTPRAKDQLGISAADVHDRCPHIITVALAGFGEDGPYRDYLAYGLTVEGFAGVSSVTGYAGSGTPVRSSVPYGDPVAASYGALAVLSGLRWRNQHGRGVHIELSQHEGLTSMLPDLFLRLQLERAVPEPDGNDDVLFHAPHGTFACAGENQWVAISVTSDAQWAALCAAIERPDLAGRTTHGERDAADVTAAIAAWTADRRADEVADALQSRGIAAAPVLSPGQMMAHEQVQARGVYEEVPHPRYRPMAYAQSPIRWPGRPARPDVHAPLFGEHNRYVFGELLGLSDDEIVELYATGVTGDRPDMA